MGRWTCAALVAAALATGCSRPEVMNPQFVRDRMLGASIGYELIGAIDQALVGQPLGEVELDVDCQSGSLHLAGTLSQTPALSEAALEVELRGCRFAVDYGFYNADFTLDGQAALQSSWSLFIEDGRDDLTAEKLRIVGDEEYELHPSAYDDECDYDFSSVSNETSDAFLGTICGRPFSASLSHKG